MRSIVAFLCAAILLVALIGPACDKPEPPTREHFPVIRQQLSSLQEAVRLRDKAAIDSILTPGLRDSDDGAEALLAFVYGEKGSFEFDVFGDYEIVYTNKRARADCYIMDGSASHDRPVTFTFELKNDQWLLKRFEVTTEPLHESDIPDQDSL